MHDRDAIVATVEENVYDFARRRIEGVRVRVRVAKIDSRAAFRGSGHYRGGTNTSVRLESPGETTRPGIQGIHDAVAATDEDPTADDRDL